MAHSEPSHRAADEAYSWQKKALELQQEAGHGEIELAQAMGNLADTLRNIAGRDFNLALLVEVRSLQARVYQTYESILGENHFQTLMAKESFAVTLSELGNIPAALRIHKELVTQFEKSDRGDTLDYAQILNNYSVALNGSKDFRTSIRMAERALKIKTRRLGDAHPSTLTTAVNLAITMIKVGDRQGAASLLLAAFTRACATLAPSHPSRCWAATNLFLLLAHTGVAWSEICDTLGTDTIFGLFSAISALLRHERLPDGFGDKQSLRECVTELPTDVSAALRSSKFDAQSVLEMFVRSETGGTRRRARAAT